MDEKWPTLISAQVTNLQVSIEKRLSQFHTDVNDLRKEINTKLENHDARVEAHSEKMQDEIEKLKLENSQTKTRIIVLVLLASSGSHGLVNLISSIF